MADLTITAANVIAGSGAATSRGVSAATVTAGQVVTSGQVLADNNSGTAALRSPAGIALHAAASGQPLTLHTSGPLTIGATLTVGTVYCLSDTPGGICPISDLATGEYVTTLGIATSASVLDVKIHESGVAVP